ncbi:MAG: hypothetical protein R3284_09005 [Rubricoccaceae bacterium]|nr:hypothetical protein [Rubricoccaceae bacterium]
MNITSSVVVLAFLASSSVGPSEVELGQEARDALVLAPKTLMNVKPSWPLDAAISKGSVKEISATTTPNEGSVVGHVTYEAIAVSDTRSFMPKVLCVSDAEGAWIHCQDESIVLVQLEGYRAVGVSPRIENEVLRAALEFIDSASLLSVGNKPWNSDHVYHVNPLGQGIAVHARVDDEWPSVYLRKLNGLYELWGGMNVHGLEPPAFLNGKKHDAT